MQTEEEFRRIYDLTYRRTAAYILAKARQTADAADLIQEVYLELYRILLKRGSSYIKAPEALVARLTRQTLARYYRRLGRQIEVYSVESEDEPSAELTDIEALSVEEITEDREVITWTERYLAAKSEEIRKIYQLYYRFGMTIPELAQHLGRSESDIKNKLYRTLKEIRAYWKGENL